MELTSGEILLIIAIYQVVFTVIMYKVLSREIRYHTKNPAGISCNIDAITLKEVVIYDIPAVAEMHIVDTVPAGTNIIIKEIKPCQTGRWYLIEFGSKVGYCPSKSLGL